MLKFQTIESRSIGHLNIIMVKIIIVAVNDPDPERT